MKTTIKRTLATVLTVVMIFSLIPFAGTIFGSMATKASAAEETIDGSYDYLADYILENGSYDSNLFGAVDIFGERIPGILFDRTEEDLGDGTNITTYYGIYTYDECSFIALVAKNYTSTHNNDYNDLLVSEDHLFIGCPENRVDDLDCFYVTGEKIYYDYINELECKETYHGRANANSETFDPVISYHVLWDINNIQKDKYIEGRIKSVKGNLLAETIIWNKYLEEEVGFGLANLEIPGFDDYVQLDSLKPYVEPDEPTVEPDEPIVDPDEPIVDPDEPTVDPDKPSVDPDKPSVDPDKPSVEPEKPEDSKTPSDPSKPADSVTPGDSKTTTSDAQKESGVKADPDAVLSYKSSANRDGGTSPDTSESMDGIIAAVVTAFVGVTGLIIVKKKEKNED